jgi:hypothetical protein
MVVIKQNTVNNVVKVNTGIDLTSASVISIDVMKPDGTTASWAATKSTTYLLHTLTTGDVDDIGQYKLVANVDGELGDTAFVDVVTKFG